MTEFRIAYDDHNSSSSELLMTNNKPTVHQQNIHVLMEEVSKFKNGLFLPFIDDMAQVLNINCNLRHFQKQ